MYIIRTFLLSEFGFYAYHRFLGHMSSNGLHGKHHNRLQEYEQSFRWDEVRGSTAMVVAHMISPFKINVIIYYSYMAMLLGIHRACHLCHSEDVYFMSYFMSFHQGYHKEHHNNPKVNFAIVTPLMDLLFGTCHLYA